MVLVSVRQDNAAQFIRIALYVSEIRNDEINAEHFSIGEGKTAVNDEHIIGAFDHGHILADLTEPAQRNDLHRGFCALLLLFLRCALDIRLPRRTVILPAGFLCCLLGDSSRILQHFLGFFALLLLQLFADKLQRTDLSADRCKRDSAALGFPPGETALSGTVCISVQMITPLFPQIPR